MRIAIDGRALTGRYTGDRTYWLNLVRALVNLEGDDEYLLYHRLPLPPGGKPETPRLTCRQLEGGNDRIWTLFSLPRALRRDGAELVHVQYTAPPPLLCGCPVVTTVHDISFRLYPEWFPLRHRLLLNLTVPASMRRAARVITDSESSRADMLREYRLAPDKVIAIPLGLPQGFEALRVASASEQESARAIAKERFGIGAPFALAVGVLQPRKNLPVLAEAFGLAKRMHGLPHELVFVGKGGWGVDPESLRRAAAKQGGEPAANALRFPGYVADDDLPTLYRACDLFAHPALYEGFGLPPLEAMACGAPTIVSDAPAMPEIVGDAALVVPARDVMAWSEAIARVGSDRELRRKLAEAGIARAARFTWRATAERTVAVYRAARVAQGR